jgi:hypothetical protein
MMIFRDIQEMWHEELHGNWVSAGIRTEYHQNTRKLCYRYVNLVGFGN